MSNTLISFFSKYVDLTKEEELALLSLNIIKLCPKGTVLLKEGELTNKGFLVLKGCIRVYFNVEGEEKTTEIYTEMEGICPECSHTNMPSKYYIDCLEDSIISVGDSKTGEEMLQKFPKFETVCRLAAEEQLLKMQFSLNNLKINSPEKRYRLLQESRPDLLQRLPQQIIASYLGITPQSLSRIRSRIKNKKGKLIAV